MHRRRSYRVRCSGMRENGFAAELLDMRTASKFLHVKTRPKRSHSRAADGKIPTATLRINGHAHAAAGHPYMSQADLKHAEMSIRSILRHLDDLTSESALPLSTSPDFTNIGGTMV